MSRRINLPSSSEHTLGFGYGSTKPKQCIAHLALACLVPVGYLKASGALLFDPHCILQGMHLIDIGFVVRVYQSTNSHKDVARPNLLSIQSVAAGPVDNSRCVLVLVENLHRHKTISGIWQGYS